MYSVEDELKVSLDMACDFEGFEAEEYICPAGYPTIGHGRNLDVYPLEDHEPVPMTEEHSRLFTASLLKDVRLSLMVYYPWLVEQPPAVRILLTDMAFNIGGNGLSKFKKMLAALKAKDYKAAAYELKDSKYYTQTGRRARAHFRTLLWLSTEIGE